MDWLWGVEKLSPAVVGFLGAWLGSRWGVTKFKREKHWETKIKTYETVIHCFETIGYWGDNEGNEAFLEVRVGGLEEGVEQFHHAMRQLAQVGVTGAIYLSPEFRNTAYEKRLKIQQMYIGRIREINDELGHGEDYIYYNKAELYIKISKLAYESVEELNLIAEKDIGVEGNKLLPHLSVKMNEITNAIRDFQKDLR
ncbi:hypothetical protein QUH49_06775 [Klebsiella pneumoniae]|uniref:hypothetical protein n=7 Tax=Klebsiella pneumoniae TaxID=573 RepID=UPI0025A2F3E9|nr:hypothetical protein [Klebsiella pneumoniae]MDM7182265.1 hypothetical protein [Klebsiella pneumoniae]